MTKDGGDPRHSKLEICEFMGRLGHLTTAVYPLDIPENSEDRYAHLFNVDSWRCISPVLISLARLIVHVLLPYLAVPLLVVILFSIFRNTIACVVTLVMLYFRVSKKDFAQVILGQRPIHPSGLYYRRSPRAEAIVSRVPTLQHPHYKGTPWILGGDMATIFPFLAFRHPKVDYIRRWLVVDTKHKPTMCHVNDGPDVDDVDNIDEGWNCVSEIKYDADQGATGIADNVQGSKGEQEAIALDLALPDGGLDPTKPFYLILHGLNGGSAETYVLDFVFTSLKRGCGACVMISRGCMGTPVRGSEIFHGARVSDVADTVNVLRQVLPKETPLALVGFSMGGVVALNYATIFGHKSRLACCVSMSGTFDTRTNMLTKHSLCLWQPMLALNLKKNFVCPNLRKIVARGIDLAKVEKARNVLEFDTYMMTPFNGYACVTNYYIDMSASAKGKLAGLKTPLLAVSALDDPIMTVAGSPIEQVQQMDDVFILLTRTGGHVGWPLGWWPHEKKWDFMSSTTFNFCEAVIATAPMTRPLQHSS